MCNATFLYIVADVGGCAHDLAAWRHLGRSQNVADVRLDRAERHRMGYTDVPPVRAAVLARRNDV